MVWIEPVRDWNRPKSRIILSLKTVWIEPVRDWNMVPLKYRFLLSMVWIEPVRDWNAYAKSICMGDTKSVNWTCEGLKPHHSQAGGRSWRPCELNLWGIETSFSSTSLILLTSVNWTCEGLKLDINHRTFNFQRRVNWTCEGLKLSFPILSVMRIQVWIEPVRDWNGICL